LGGKTHSAAKLHWSKLFSCKVESTLADEQIFSTASGDAVKNFLCVFYVLCDSVVIFLEFVTA
jgi:hypothetical protein